MLSNKIIFVDHPIGWSGVPQYLLSKLKLAVREVVVVGDVSMEERTKAVSRMATYTGTGRRYFPDRDVELLKYRSERILQKLAAHRDADAIVVLHPPDAAFLDTKIPITILHDATWRQFTDTYPGFTRNDLVEESYVSGFLTERLAFGNAENLVFWTHWAASSARAEYPEFQKKIHVVLPGANLPSEPTWPSIEQAMQDRMESPCQLLFIGYDTYRKGLDIAVRATECLCTKGIPAVLHVVGNMEGQNVPHSEGDHVRFHGMLNKADSESWSLLCQLHFSSFLFLFPSRAECAGLVLCEAAAFGLPAIVSQVGGMPELVLDGKTGYVVENVESPEKFAGVIAQLWSDPVSYRNLTRNARERYERTLNWRQSVEDVMDVIYRSSNVKHLRG